MPYTMEEMHTYGYHWDQMVPLLWIEAFSFISADPDNGNHLFLLYKDGTESQMKSIQELDFHKGMFGVEKKTYEQYLMKNRMVRKQLDYIERTEETVELALETDRGSFTIVSEQDGYRFAFYDKELLLTDQGLFPYRYSLSQTVNRLMCDHFIEMEHCRFTDYDGMMIKVEERFGSKPLDLVHVELKRDTWQLPEYRIQTSDDAVAAMQRLIRDLDKEAFVILNLSTKNQVINASVCTVGTMTATMVEPGEVFRTAICSGSTQVIAMHNHPSGDCTPSREDDEVTKRLAAAGDLLGIQVLDHIVVGGYDSFSYRQERPELFEADDNISRGMRTAEAGNYVSRKEKVAQITEKLQEAVKDFCQGEQYKTYLDTVAKFHNYSFNNCLLIAMQRPGASLVAGYNAWSSKFERHVIKGEKGIQILSPVWKEVENEKTGELEQKIVAFKPAYVFDVSQTEGKELPSLTRNLTEAVTDFETKKELLAEIASVPIEFRETENPEVHGYYHLVDKKIVVRPDMSESQTLKTLIHEIAHSEMHIDLQDKQSRESKEIEAESVAYVVCKYFQLDTSDYSFGYISGWSSDREVSELQESLKKVNSVATDIIGRLEKAAEKKGLLEKSESKDKTKGEEKHEKTVRKTGNYCCTA